MQINILKYKKAIISNLLIASLAILDQVTKHISVLSFKSLCPYGIENCSKTLLPILNLTFVCNKGVSFGMLSSIKNGNYILFCTSFIIFIIFARMLTKSRSKTEQVALIFILSGALGNLIDRITTSCVIDFIHFHFNDYHFPVFNLADSFVTIGGMIIFWSESRVFLKKYFNKTK